MDGRLALISGAVFAGVLLAGGLASTGNLDPAGAFNSLTGSDSPEQRVNQDQPLVADTSNAAAQQASEVSFAPSGEHREDGEHDGGHDKDEREDD